MIIPVSKYHGCGNDFILIDEKAILDLNTEQRIHLVQEVCDRHTGIGADGCILVGHDPLEMIYYNQDGSRADMCGNGLRCFARFVSEHGIVSKPHFSVLTRAGIRDVQILDSQFDRILLNLGKPFFSVEKLNLDMNFFPDPLILEIEDHPVEIHCIYMNTMHTVVFVEDAFDPKLEKLGEKIGNHPLFKDRTNVNFVEIKDKNHIRASTWERGCGMTLACATGMAASAVQSVKKRHLDRRIQVEMKKGILDIEIQEDGSVLLCGPARKILEGEYYYEQTTA